MASELIACPHPNKNQGLAEVNFWFWKRWIISEYLIYSSYHPRNSIPTMCYFEDWCETCDVWDILFSNIFNGRQIKNICSTVFQLFFLKNIFFRDINQSIKLHPLWNYVKNIYLKCFDLYLFKNLSNEKKSPSVAFRCLALNSRKMTTVGRSPKTRLESPFQKHDFLTWFKRRCLFYYNYDLILCFSLTRNTVMFILSCVYCFFS